MTKDSNVLKLDTADFTLGEIELIEEIGGIPIGWLGREDKPQGKAMVAVAYAIGLRKDPKYTLEQARNMRIEVEETKDVPPTEKSDSGSTSL